MRYRCTASVLGSSLGLLAAPAPCAQAACDPFKITASDAAPADQFGAAVAVSGDTLIVGARLDDDAGLDSGAAYIYRWTGAGWTEEAKLVADDAGAGDNFGRSVDIHGDTAIVGAHLDDDAGTSSGSAYIFTRVGAAWIQQAKLTADDAAPVDSFGWSVAIDGDTALVGALADDSPRVDAGSAYVFTRTGADWTQQAKLTARGAAQSDFFGISVALSGDTALVGAYLNDVSNADAGAAYVFTRSGSVWLQQARLLASDAEPNDFFGIAVALDGNTAVVAAQGRDDNGSGAGAAYAFARTGDNWSQQAKLLADDGAAGDRFGGSVSIAGDTAVIGAYFDDDHGSDAGSAYVFTRSAAVWVQQTRLSSADAAGADEFGRAVAVDGDTVVVGASGDDDAAGADQGSAHVFSRIGPLWVDGRKILASDGAAGAEFGIAVAIDGDTAIVGAHRDDEAGEDAGAVYVYTRVGSTWTEQAKFFADDADAGDNFGFAVALSADTAIIGAHLEDGAGSNSGAAYAFVRNGAAWTQQAKLLPADAAAQDRFGVAVSIDGDTAVVGAHFEDAAGLNSGSAYVFVRDGEAWTEQAKLVADDGADDDRFGMSVAVSGDTAIVGANLDDDAGVGSGSAYIFTRDADVWSQQAKLTAGDGADGDFFGFSVAIDGDTALIGAWADADKGVSSGSAYVFVRDAGSWTQQAKLLAPDGAGGDRFAWSVSIQDGAALIGARSDNDGGAGSGSAYIFQGAGAGWNVQSKLRAPDAAPGDNFGRTVAISQGAAIVGALADDDAGTDSGAAHIFTALPDTFDPCAGALVRNLVTDVEHPSLADALQAALVGDTLYAAFDALPAESAVDLTGKAIDLEIPAGIRQPSTATLTLADAAALRNLPGRDAILYGSLILPAGHTGAIEARSMRLGLASSLTAGDGATLAVDADFDAWISDSARFDMAAAGLLFASGARRFEAMSADIGADIDGFDPALPGGFPIGTFQLAAGATVDLVDLRDNDGAGQDATEAVYASTLIVDDDATLNTNGLRVYYRTLMNTGAVDVLANLIQVGACIADFNADSMVDGEDLAGLLANWGSCSD